MFLVEAQMDLVEAVGCFSDRVCGVTLMLEW